MTSTITEQEATQLGADVRAFMDKVEQDEKLFDLFQQDPVTALNNNGIQIPADKVDQIKTDLKLVFGEMGFSELQESWACWSCNAGLTIVFGILVGAAMAAIVAAVAVFFNVAAAAAMPWVSAAFDIGVVGGTALAAYICWKAKVCKSSTVGEMALA